MHRLAAVIGFMAAAGHVATAGAATVSSRFAVGAVVAASCAVTLPGVSAALPAGGICSPSASPAAAAPPQPLVFITHDGELTRINVEF